jgi:transcriptional regulator with GAF, ATPase, and Fis domain
MKSVDILRLQKFRKWEERGGGAMKAEFESAFFREMTLRICGSLDIEQALREAFDYLQHFVPVDVMGLGFNNLDQEKIESGFVYVVAHTAKEGAEYVWDKTKTRLKIPDELVAFIKSKGSEDPATIVVNTPREQPPSMLKVFPGLSTNSVLFLLLQIREEKAGVLLLSTQGHNQYTSEHAHLLETLREPFAVAMTNARRYQELEAMKELLDKDNRALQAELKSFRGMEVVGADFGLREVMEQVRLIAPSNSPVLLLGETGTGKEVIANAIHTASPRNSRPMISFQCGAVPESLLDSELFGHEKGAFTGALERKQGRFERADGGTLFLDEIGELSLEAQVKLLRVLQEKTFERLGGTKSIQVDVRVIAATHRDLESMMKEGKFREDLWYRLNVLPIRIPPLRFRREDIPSLVQYFVREKARELNLPSIPFLSNASLEQLKGYDWPGNVRELQNIVERALLLSRGETLSFPTLSSKEAIPLAKNDSQEIKSTQKLSMEDVVAEHIRLVLKLTKGKIAGKGGAAELLQMNPSTLYFRMKKLNIQREP